MYAVRGVIDVCWNTHTYTHTASVVCWQCILLSMPFLSNVPNTREPAF